MRASSPKGPENANQPVYSGRLSLLIGVPPSPSSPEPVRSFSGGFELMGSPEQGQLRLATPLGSVAAELRWGPGYAQLLSAQGQQNHASVAALVEAATGAAIPLEALFAWLRGSDADVPGWQADLSGHAQGRIRAQRLQPLPGLDLRIILERIE